MGHSEGNPLAAPLGPASMRRPLNHASEAIADVEAGRGAPRPASHGLRVLRRLSV
jgi:hypothetical protein